MARTVQVTLTFPDNRRVFPNPDTTSCLNAFVNEIAGFVGGGIPHPKKAEGMQDLRLAKGSVTFNGASGTAGVKINGLELTTDEGTDEERAEALANLLNSPTGLKAQIGLEGNNPQGGIKIRFGDQTTREIRPTPGVESRTLALVREIFGAAVHKVVAEDGLSIYFVPGFDPGEITVDTSGLGRNNAQYLLDVDASGGTYTLTATVSGGPFGTTEPIAFDADEDAIREALEDVVGVGNVQVEEDGGGDIRVLFNGAYAGTPATLTGDDGDLTGELTVDEEVEGGTDPSASVVTSDLSLVTSHVKAKAEGDRVDLEAKITGPAGNAVTLEAVGTGVSVSGDRLTGGSGYRAFGG